MSNQETELFVLSSVSISGLLRRTQALINQATGMSVAELIDLAAQLTGEIESFHPVRAAVIAGTPNQLIERLQQLEQMLNHKPPVQGEVIVSPNQDIWLSDEVKRCRVAFLFPGQGSQKLNMARTLVERYSWAREFVQKADQWFEEIGVESVSKYIYRPSDRAANQEQMKEWLKLLTRTEIAQPALCLTSLLWKRYLEELGIKPVAVGGHSLGELTAFQAAGAFDEKALLILAAIRGRAMSVSTLAEADAGSMASLSCSQQIAEKLLQQVDGYVVVANNNK